MKSILSTALCQQRDVHSDFYWSSGVSEKNICWFIAICFLFVWCAALVAWCSFTSHWDVTRICDPGRCCLSIRCTQEHCRVPMDTLSRGRFGARPTAFRMATCNVTVKSCLLQGHALMQSLSVFWAHLIYDVIRSGNSDSISAKLFVCYTTEVVTYLSINLWTKLWIVKVMADPRVWNFCLSLANVLFNKNYLRTSFFYGKLSTNQKPQ